MTPENFAYWLNGYVEMHGTAPSEQQWNMIKEHLALTMVKITSPLMALPLQEQKIVSGATMDKLFEKLDIPRLCASEIDRNARVTITPRATPIC